MGGFNPLKPQTWDQADISIGGYSIGDSWLSKQLEDFNPVDKAATELERFMDKAEKEADRVEEKIKDALESWGSTVEGQTNELAGLNADAIRAESAENVRRSELQYADLRSQVTGIQSSSGFLSSVGTNVDYVKKMDTSFQKEIDYINKSTESQIAITLLEGEIQGKIAKNNERSGDINNATSVLGIF